MLHGVGIAALPEIVISCAIENRGEEAGRSLTERPPARQGADLSAIGAATGLGCAVVVALVVTIGGGILLDSLLGTAPILTLVGVALGLIAAGYQLWELAQIGRTDRPAPPLTRGLAHLPVPRAGRARGGDMTPPDQRDQADHD